MKYIAIALSILAVFSCSTARVVKTEKAPGTDFSSFKTYDFFRLDASGDTSTDRFGSYTALLQKAIQQELNSKGFSQNSSNPDLRVNIGIVVNEKTQTRETHIREAPRYIGQRRYSWKSENVEVGRYKSGTATIELVNSKSNEMVWLGIMEGIIAEKKKNYESDVNKGVAELFARFPD